MLVYIDGNYYDEDKANIKIFDKWFLKGMALTQKIRTYNKKPFLLDEAISLLFEDLRKVSTPFEKTKQDVKDAVLQTILKNNYDNALVHIIIILSKKTYLVVLVEKLIESIESTESNQIESNRSNALFISSTYRNYDFNVLQEFNIAIAHEDAVKSRCIEVILTNGNTIMDCAYGSLFIVKDGVIYSPKDELKRPFHRLINSFVNSSPSLAIEIKKTKLVKKDIFNLDECFYANSVLGVVPITKIENVIIPSGNIAKTIKERWNEYVATL